MTTEIPSARGDEPGERPRWTFLTNHLHVLGCVARDPELRIRDIAGLVGITERAAAQILGQLEESGYLTRTRVGRRNRYTVHGQLPLRHPLHDGHQVGELLRIIAPRGSEASDASGGSAGGRAGR